MRPALFIFLQEFIGNKDRNTIVTNWFLPRFTARFIQIKPKTWQDKICMRTEIMGCFGGKMLKGTAREIQVSFT